MNPRCRKFQIKTTERGRVSSKTKTKTKKKKKKKMACKIEVSEDDALDLHRLRSDLSSLLHQIDELVEQAIQLKSVSKEGKTQIQSFSRLLSDMLSSLKPWVPRFQNAVHSETHTWESKPVSHDDESIVCDSPEDTLVSPSPLVSWRANCTVERGRQMFMLTPLPLSSKPNQPRFPPSTSTFLTLSRDMTALMDSIVVKPTPIKPPNEVPKNLESELVSSPTFPKRDRSMLVMMTPCLKMSPPKSCVLLEPISEISHMGNDKVRKCTPFPVGVHYSDSEASESPGCDDYAKRGLSSKYPELLGISHVSKSGIGKKTVEEWPDWLTSPPKTCVLLEPPDEKSLDTEKTDNDSFRQITEGILKQQVSTFKKDDVSEDHNQDKKSCNQDHFVGNLSRIESTPMWQEPESSFQTGKRPGENTLKKELWTKFEAASTWGCQPKFSTVQKNTQKGFLDLLEEACCDD